MRRGGVGRYRAVPNERTSFRNIQITVTRGNLAMVSKCNAPIVHFVIRHPVLCDALRDMAIPAED